MFQNPQNFSINGGNFTVVAGKDIWHNHIAPGAFHNSRERLEYDPPKCHPETRVAVIQAIIDWIEDGQKTTFIKWLNGAAGVGKSAIAQEIAELCHKSGRLAASFFWSRSAAGRNDEERLIASLAYQLCTVIPQLRGPVESAVEVDPYIFTRSLQSQVESLIIQPLKDVFESDQQGQVDTPMVIIFDGLDECGTPEAQQYILRLIADSVLKFPIPLCFLIASRPEKAIRDSFNDQPLLALTDLLVLDEKYRPDDDIRLFLVESFESVKRTHELRSLLPAVWPSDDDIYSLVAKSSGQFIYAATVVKFVKFSRQRPNKQLDIILGVTAAGTATPFAELDALYSTIFSLVPKEDLHKALEIISVVMFIKQSLTARQIETILSYPHGELQRILIDMHSVLHVPALKSEGEETDEEVLRILHASLQDFLRSPSRSKDIYVDKGVACEHIARHFLRFMQEYSDDTVARYPHDRLAFEWFSDIICDASPTKELLLQCFDFDPVKWVSVLFKDFQGLHYSLISDYLRVESMHSWFQTQEAHVLEHLGPTRSLKAYHFHSWEVALDLVCKEICCGLYGTFPKLGEDMATMLTHPLTPELLTILVGVGDPLAFWEVYPYEFLLGPPYHYNALQKYICDEGRAGQYFVDGGRYTSLCMYLLKVVLDFQLSSEAYNETFDDMNDSGITGIFRPNHKGALKYAILTLPFHLSNADYNPTLAELSCSVLARNMEELELPEFREEIELLHNAINLYLKKDSVTPNGAKPDEAQTVAEHPKAGKRIRRAITALTKVMRRR